MSHMPKWAVGALRLPSRRLWGCLRDWRCWVDRVHSIQHYCQMWYLYFHTPQLPVSAFLSPLLGCTLFSLWYRLFQSENTFPTIPSCSGLVWILRELSSLKMSFGMKNTENSTFRDMASFRNQFAFTDSSKVKETMLSFVGRILQFTCYASHKEGAPWKAL